MRGVPPLSKTNPHIRTKVQRKDAIAESVISSSACEGIKVKRKDLPLNGGQTSEPRAPEPPKG